MNQQNVPTFQVIKACYENRLPLLQFQINFFFFLARVIELCACAVPGPSNIGTQITLLNLFIKQELLSSFTFQLVFIFLSFFFLMWTIFKVFIEFATVLLLFYVLFFWPQACGTLAAQPGSKPKPHCTGRRSLNAVFSLM